jgi:hypothetical protein
VRLVKGTVYGRSDDGVQMRRVFETLVGDGLGIGEMRLKEERIWGGSTERAH